MYKLLIYKQKYNISILFIYLFIYLDKWMNDSKWEMGCLNVIKKISLIWMNEWMNEWVNKLIN